MVHTIVQSPVGALATRTIGSGPPAVLWHSLFMDDRSWVRVEKELATNRQLIFITGPGHGGSADPGRRYTMQDCASAAATVLDAFGIDEQVDWIGNAWGGHVGVVFAATRPTRCRTLVTIGTPIQSYDVRARLETMILLAVFRLVGAPRFIQNAVVETMLAPKTRAEDPEAVAMLRDCLVNADRIGLANAVHSISLRREDLAGMLPGVSAPTLFITGTEHSGWTPRQATEYSKLLPNGSSTAVADAAYLVPLEAPDDTVRIIREFWASASRTSA
jgi:pimeloyl-ACP methyl ester carboxylesterase